MTGPGCARSSSRGSGALAVAGRGGRLAGHCERSGKARDAAGEGGTGRPRRLKLTADPTAAAFLVDAFPEFAFDPSALVELDRRLEQVASALRAAPALARVDPDRAQARFGGIQAEIRLRLSESDTVNVDAGAVERRSRTHGAAAAQNGSEASIQSGPQGQVINGDALFPRRYAGPPRGAHS